MYHDSNSWQYVEASPADGTRPTITAWGTSITPGNNTYGSYTEIMSNTADEVWMVEFTFTENAVAGATRDTIVTIGADFAGGTTYTDLEIPHLLATNANVLSTGSTSSVGINYRFPLRFPAGTAFAAKASVNNATVGTLYVSMRVFGQPTRPELVRCGSFVRAYGADTANSRGTLVTAGGASEGSWTSVGTLADDIWAWEVGYGTSSSGLAAAVRHVDLGVGSTQKVVLPNAVFTSGTSESIAKSQSLFYGDGASGQDIYARIQHSSAADTNASIIAYGVGG